MTGRQPTRRRTNGEVDYQALVGYILRRCGTGCAPDYVLVVADNFFDNTSFDSDVREQVTEMLRLQLPAPTAEFPSGARQLAPVVLNGSTICRKCGRRAEVHPVDKEQSHLVILCTGQRIRPSL